MSSKNDLPNCYGELDIVFPKGKDDLRHTPQTCMACSQKTNCLRSAVKDNNGITVKQEMVDRAYASGVMGFWKRWSIKKQLGQKSK